MSGDDKKTCFIAMPITTHDHEAEKYADAAHWEHVMETLFVKAVEAAGYVAIRPVTSGSHMIHGQIIKHLATADLVLCDLSAHNPNVFFELGVRTSLNLPIALVAEQSTTLPFDTSGINTLFYRPTLHGWEIEEEVRQLADHIRASADGSAGSNPLWRHFGLTIAATKPEATESAPDAKLELIYEGMQDLRRRIDHMDREPRTFPHSQNDESGVTWSDFIGVRDKEAAVTISKLLGSQTFDTRRLRDSHTVEFRTPGAGVILTSATKNRIVAELRTRGYRLESITAEGEEIRIRTVDLDLPKSGPGGAEITH